MIAKVVVEIALDREFDYRIPPELSSQVRAGSRVLVPFGKSTATGYVTALAEKSSWPNLKSVQSVVGTKPYISETLLGLAQWMGEYYCAPVELAVRTVLPGAVRRRGARFRTLLTVSLADAVAEHGAPSAAMETRRQSAAATEDGECAGSPVVAALCRRADIKSDSKQAAVLADLAQSGPTPLQELTRRLKISEAPVRTLAKRGLVTIESAESRRDPLANRTLLRTSHLDLMPEQAEALTKIRASVDEAGAPAPRQTPSVMLLYGVTGSGKTEVYLQGIDYALGKGRGAIVLVPEISLTPQTVERFVGRFGDRVAVLHSHLSDGERHDEWHRIHEGAADIVVGARSAVFAPVRNLGLIVVDEEHEPSYKQDEAPRYNARDVAVMRGAMEGCAVVLGSATPSVESWRNAQAGKYGLCTLPRRADDRKMPFVQVVDMRIEMERTGHPSVFSRELTEAIHARLQRAEQTILFLNRRGYATSLVCPKCGYVARCSECSVSLTYHRTDETLRCHICGGCHKTPKACPQCSDPSFRFAGVGTQRVETVAAKLFPHARIQRMDADVTGKKDAYERIFGEFRTGKIDILIGTQMIAKGLHFPNVTLVGVVYADLGLHLPDFRAGERTFQLLAQVAGRAGRGATPGEVIVQTYTPFHIAVQAARRTDFEGFCDQELAFRKELKYPPFSHLVCLTLKGESEEKVSFCTEALARALKPKLPAGVILSEPGPAPLAKAKGSFRFQLILRHPSTRAMTGPLREVMRAFKAPDGVSVSVDVDAVSVL